MPLYALIHVIDQLDADKKLSSDPSYIGNPAIKVLELSLGEVEVLRERINEVDVNLSSDPDNSHSIDLIMIGAVGGLAEGMKFMEAANNLALEFDFDDDLDPSDPMSDE